MALHSLYCAVKKLLTHSLTHYNNTQSCIEQLTYAHPGYQHCNHQCHCQLSIHTSLGIALFGSTVFPSILCGRSCKQASTISGELYVIKPNPLDLFRHQFITRRHVIHTLLHSCSV